MILVKHEVLWMGTARKRWGNDRKNKVVMKNVMDNTRVCRVRMDLRTRKLNMMAFNGICCDENKGKSNIIFLNF